MSLTTTTKRDDHLVARNPATGLELGRVASTPPGRVDELVARARSAQAAWSATPWSERRRVIDAWRRVLSREADAWAELICSEIGKPRIEALGGDVVSTLDGLRWTVRNAGSMLKERRIGPSWQRALMMPGGVCRWAPFGVVGMLGTWNYPLFLNAPPIAQALAAGNAVVWKSSEASPLCGAKLEQGLRAAGVPDGLVAVVQGGPDVGRALVESSIDKGMFTGGVENGRQVLASLGRRGIPALAELSGFDPAIILPDAPRERSVRSLTWAAFVGCGQACVAVKRIYVVGDPEPWAAAIAEQAGRLRVGDPSAPGTDIGPLISERARQGVHSRVESAIAAGARPLVGGAPGDGPGAFYPPTVLLGHSPAAEDALAGVFGPVVIVRGVPDAEAAVRAANRSPFALAASVWGRDRRRAIELSHALEAGMVTINDAVTPTAHAFAPFGGSKASGYGRTKGPFGLMEFAQTQVIFPRSTGGFRPQLFPYGSPRSLKRFFSLYRSLFHPSRGPRGMA